MTVRPLLTVVAWALFAGAGAAAPVGAQEGSADLERLRADIDAVLAAPGWRRADWGVLAVSLDTGDTLYARSASVPLAPASNVKLLTTAAALHHLGPDFRFVTLLLTEAPVESGVLAGDLVLYGTGDPGLSDRFFERDRTVFDSLALELRASGVRVIEGRVLGDGTFFDGPGRLEAWDPRDLNDAFAAASGALSWAENVVTLRVEPGTAGTPPVVHGIPALAGVGIRNDATTVTGRPGERFRIERADPAAPIEVLGDLGIRSADVWRRMTVQDPALYAAHAFRAALEEAGIAVVGGVGTAEPGSSPIDPRARVLGSDGPRILLRHRSAPLREYLAVINQESHNLFADQVLRMLGRVVAGEGSYVAGARVVERFMSDVVGVPEGDVRLFDGSGLAATNRASPGAFVTLLGHMAGRGDWEEYLATLPEAGQRGFRRMRRTAAAGNLRAKTGTIEGVSALSGVVRARTGERIAFSILGNELPSAYGAKRLEDRIGARLAELDRRIPTVPAVSSATGR